MKQFRVSLKTPTTAPELGFSTKNICCGTATKHLNAMKRVLVFSANPATPRIDINVLPN